MKHVFQDEFDDLGNDLPGKNLDDERCGFETKIDKLYANLFEVNSLLHDISTRPDIPVVVRNWIEAELSFSAKVK